MADNTDTSVDWLGSHHIECKFPVLGIGTSPERKTIALLEKLLSNTGTAGEGQKLVLHLQEV
ncbi:MAG: hypothetical protein ACH37Z_15720 [Anaerolineae bacterium]|jgi:hypothetical protein